MKLPSRKWFQWMAACVVVMVAVVTITIALAWRQCVSPQAGAVAKLKNMGAICLYDFEYDFAALEGRIPDYQRPSAPSPILRYVLGNDWLAVPVYVQFTGDQVRDRDVAILCDTLSELPTVHHLSLRETRVGDESSLCLRKLEQLKVLDIRGSEFTPKGKRSLEGSLPACHVLFGEENVSGKAGR